MKVKINPQAAQTASKIGVKMKKFINNDEVLLVICWIIAIIPILVGWGLWAWLDPIGFWQKTVMVICYALSLFPLQILSGVFGIFMQNEYNKEKRLKRQRENR
jgi:hypothetical protein